MTCFFPFAFLLSYSLLCQEIPSLRSHLHSNLSNNGKNMCQCSYNEDNIISSIAQGRKQRHNLPSIM